MTRDLAALLLFMSAAGLLLLAWFLLRSHRIEAGRWLGWPLSINLGLANMLLSLSVLVGVLGVLALGGTGPLQWWALALCLYPAVSIGAFWLMWSRGGGGNDGGDVRGD